MKFYSTIRIDIRRAEAIKSGSDIVGNTVKIKIVKNKVAPPFRNCTIDLLYGEGFSKYGELLDMGEEFKLIRKTGNWYEVDGEKIGNGREAAKTFLKSHPEVADRLEAQIREIFEKGEQEEDDGVISETDE